MKQIGFLAVLAFAFAGAAQAAPVVEMPQDAPRVFINSAEAGPIVMLPYQGAVAAPVVAAIPAPAVVAKTESSAAGCMVALAGTTIGTR